MTKIKKRNNKIVFWIHPHISYWNGGTRYIYEVLKALSNRYEIKLIVSAANDGISEEFTRIGIEVIRTNSTSTFSPTYWLTLPIHLWREHTSIKRIIALHPEATIISTLFPANYLASRAAKNSIQICWEPYAYFYDADLVKSLEIKKRIFTKLTRLLYEHLDTSSTNSAASLLTLNKSTGEWVKKIYNRPPDGYTYMGVDSKHFRNVRSSTIRDSLKFSHTILHSTDYTELKGTRWAIKALPLIVKTLKDTLLLITTPHQNPEEDKKLYNLARSLGVQNNIKIVGSVSYEKLPEYYSSADLLLFTGIGDSGAGAAASLTVLESLACETPVVRSKYTEEEVVNGENGYLVNAKDPIEVSTACIKILKNKRKSAIMGKRGRERVIKLYNWQETAKRIEKYFVQ